MNRWVAQSGVGYYWSQELRSWVTVMQKAQRFESPWHAMVALTNVLGSDGKPIQFACAIHIVQETN
jgi:hypothetical protein